MFRPKRRVEGEVELNVTAMLDMAFQLLAFFVLTFKPAPLEQNIKLHMPPPAATANFGKPIIEQPGSGSGTLASLTTLNIRVLANKVGEIDRILVGETQVPDLKTLEQTLNGIFDQRANPFDQIVMHVAPNVHYQCLMEVIDSCVKVRLPSGERLSKLSFVELPPET